MHFDALTLACLATELKTTLTDGRVQQVLMTGPSGIGLEIYAARRRRYLRLEADRSGPFAYMSEQKLRRGIDAQPPMLLLLRKYARGARLIAIEQPDPVERVLRLRFAHPDVGESTLIFEPLGRRANLILTTAAGRILDCIQRVRPGAAQRPFMPGQTYAPPAPVDKLPPLDDGRPDYYAALAQVTQAEGKLWRAIVACVAGVSPTQARELAWRAAGSADAPAHSAELMAVAAALQALWQPTAGSAWTPGLVFEGDNPNGFAAYEVHFRGRFEPTTTMSDALERFYAAKQAADGESPALPDPYAGQRAAVANRIRQIRKRLTRQIAALAADEPAPGEPARLRRDAEWLLALASQVQPGQTALEIDLGDEVLVIPLDERKTPVEQAERMFARAAKLTRAAQIIPRRRARLEGDLAYLAQLAVDLSAAEDQPEIGAVEQELDRLGVKTGRRRKRKAKRTAAASGPRRFESPTGFEILVGRNARQNDAVTFRHSHPEDLWLHVRNAPGSHVVIRRRDEEPDEATITAAAQLAAYYSQLRGERAAPVAVTRCRFVNRLPGGRPGQVTLRNETTMTVTAELPEGLNEKIETRK